MLQFCILYCFVYLNVMNYEPVNEKGWRFRYEDVSELIRPKVKLRFKYHGVKKLIRPMVKPKV
jgi:hypothetical protein